MPQMIKHRLRSSTYNKCCAPLPLRASNAATVPSSVEAKKAVGVAGSQASASESAPSCHRRHSPPTTRMSACAETVVMFTAAASVWLTSPLNSSQGARGLVPDC